MKFQGEQKIGLFYWPKIEKITFTKKKFTIIVTEDDDNGYKQEHTFIFNLIDEKACKHLWKCAVEYHAFFRLRSSPKPINQGLNGFIRHGSRFRGPQRTEFQTTNLTLSTRRSVQFERRPSQRFTRRASYALKRKLQEQQKTREQPQVESKAHACVKTVDESSKLISVTTNAAPASSSSSSTASSSNACSSATVSIKDEAENAQARLKQIEIESTVISKQPPSRQQPSHGNCCKLQQSNGGNEHDIKCNLLKAQQYSNEKSKKHCDTCDKTCEPKKQIDSFETIVDKQKDKNEQHDDEKIKLVEKEPIASTITSAKQQTPTASVAASSIIQTNTETTITSGRSNKANRKSEVIITRTQSIYNDRNASSAMLQINDTTSFNRVEEIASDQGANRQTASAFVNKPITTEL